MSGPPKSNGNIPDLQSPCLPGKAATWHWFRLDCSEELCWRPVPKKGNNCLVSGKQANHEGQLAKRWLKVESAQILWAKGATLCFDAQLQRTCSLPIQWRQISVKVQEVVKGVVLWGVYSSSMFCPHPN